MTNNTIKEIADALKKSNTVLLYPHVGIDGDAVGSCAAIAKMLRMMGKTCYALYAEDIPDNLFFMAKDYFTREMDIISDGDLDISIAVDCGGYDRFRDFQDKFNSWTDIIIKRTRICIKCSSNRRKSWLDYQKALNP